MKKFIYTVVAALFAGLAISCVSEDEIIRFVPENTIPQTLGDVRGCTLSAEGENITLSFNKADFGFSAASVYELYAKLPDSDMENLEKVTSTISGETVTVTQKDMNNTILNLGGEGGAEFAVDFVLAGYIVNEKGVEIEGSRVFSNVISAVFVPYKADRLDVDIYEHVWVIGASSTIGAWDHAKVYQYLYNYGKDGKIFTGVIDFGEDGASGGWKLTGVAGWEDDCNWGSENGDEAEEQIDIQLISSGGSKDIKCLSKRFYWLKFDKSTLTVSVNAGWNNLGIAGSFNGWDSADPNCKMTYNDAFHRFWIDYTFSDGDELKFTADDDWNVNWGEGCNLGAGNITVPKGGSYRVYFDLNTKEYKFNEKMYGQEEPGRELPPEEPFKGWSLIGSILNTGWDTDFDMIEKSEGVFFYNGLELTEDAEFKIRKDHEWGVSYGAAGEVKIDEAFAATTDNGANIMPKVTGKYDITLNINENTILIATHVETLWSLIGVNGNWENDIDMTEVMPGIWVSPKVSVTETGWKLRMGKSWDVNRGCDGLAADGKFVKAVPGGNNIDLTGEFSVVYNANVDAIGTLIWGLVGSIASIDGFNWNADVPMNLGTDGKFYSSPVVLTTDDQFKIRYMGAWDDDRGGSMTEAEVPFAAAKGGDNIKIPANGTYMVVYDPSSETITLTKEFWGLIGDFNSWGSDKFLMNEGNGQWVAFNQAIEGGWKIRKSSGWDVSVGGVFSTVGEAFPAMSDNGPNISVSGLESFDIIYKTTDQTITVR